MRGRVARHGPAFGIMGDHHSGRNRLHDGLQLLRARPRLGLAPAQRTIRLPDPQERPHRCHQYTGFDRVGQIPVGAGLEAVRDVSGAGVCRGDMKNWYGLQHGICLETLAGLVAIHDRHVNVEDDQIKIFSCEGQARDAVVRLPNVEAFLLKNTNDGVSVGLGVIHYQDFAGRSWSTHIRAPAPGRVPGWFTSVWSRSDIRLSTYFCGIMAVKVDPWPTRLWSNSSPPRNAASLRDSGRPSPVPWKRRCSGFSI